MPKIRTLTTEEQIARFLSAVKEPGEVFEIRALKCSRGHGRKFTASGYFDDPATAADAICELEMKLEPGGIYYTLNRLDPACKARSPDHITEYAEESTTARDVLRRQWLPLDFDPKRARGVSSTNAELQRAIQLARKVSRELKRLRWGSPIEAESGNGYRLLFPIDLPNDDESAALIKAVLETLNANYSTEHVEIDAGLFDANRIDKVAGTIARKGANTKERPHRRSRVVTIPSKRRIVSVDKLRAIAQERFVPPTGVPNNGRIDIAVYLNSKGIEYALHRRGQDEIYKLTHCPFDQSHGAQGESAVIRYADGTIAYKCQHNSCHDNKWAQLKNKIGPPNGNFQVFQVPGSGAWGDPVLVDDPTDLPSFDAAWMPAQLGDWASAVAETSQTPLDLAGMMALAALATALAKKFEIQPYPDNKDYVEPANIWVCAPLTSGNRKTFVVNMARSPFEAWLRAFKKENGRELAVNRQERAALEKRKNRLTDRLANVEDDESYAEIKKELQSCIEQAAEIDVYEPRFFADDATPERLAVLMSQHRGRIAILSDEGVCFDHFAGLYSHQSNLDVYLHGHSGGTLLRDRQKDGVEICVERAALTLGISPQPQVITGLSSKNRLQGRGLLARFLWSFAKSKLGQRDWEPAPIPSAVKRDYCLTINSLLDIDFPRSPKRVKLSPAAFRKWIAVAEELEKELGEHGGLSTPGIQEWTGKLPGAIARIALLLHSCSPDRAKSELSSATMDRAVEIGRYLVQHALAAFKLLRTDPAADAARVLQKWIVDRAEIGEMKFSKSDAQQNHKNRFPNVADVVKPLQILTDRQVCRPFLDPDHRGPGRPSTWYEINPVLKPET